MRLVPVESARSGDTVLRGRPSSTREGWEAAREADAADLNRLLEAGGEVAAYVVPLWSNGDAERCLRELRGFDEARVYVELAPGEGQEEALAAVAETEWAGVASEPPPFADGSCRERREGPPKEATIEPSSFPLKPPPRWMGVESLATLIHAAASLDVPLLLPDADPTLTLWALALAIADDLSPREIEAVLRGERTGQPDEESLDRARDLLG